MRYQLTIDYGYIKQFSIEAESDADAIDKAESIITDPRNETEVRDALHIRLDRVNGHAPETNESLTTIKEF